MYNELKEMVYIETKRQNMRYACRLYRGQPIHEMTEQEAKSFAVRQAKAAAETIRMDNEETLLYADSVLAAILYFNRKDERHKRHIQYMRECQRTEQYAAKQRELQRKRQMEMQIIIR